MGIFYLTLSIVALGLFLLTLPTLIDKKKK